MSIHRSFVSFALAFAVLSWTALTLHPIRAQAEPVRVAVDDRSLLVNGQAAPFLYGAEVQYFRARGGPGRNVARVEVERLWDLLLDRVTEAHMNMVSFYVPWDFHEPVEGVFDFTGQLDRDGDGNADYPSRDLRSFLKKVEEHGIKYVMIRPGPYINAEWGPTGFGAIPLWFIENYPAALAQSRTPDKPKVASFAHPVFRDRVQHWFAALNEQVLHDVIDAGKVTVLLQLDNETNYFWDSVYERDLSPTGIARYQEFLNHTYGGDIGRLNEAYGSNFPRFATVTPPESQTDVRYGGFGWHYDWFNWHDDEIRDYYRFLRATWEGLGVREPNVLFTRCDSFNNPDHGLLPRLDYAQEGGLALSTLNIYPKTYGTQALSTLNMPMKAAHDATLLGAAHRQFYGNAGHWVMATETIGGWFPPTEVSLATRQHTYASLLGNGVKAMVIYYFHEGFNWNGLEQNDSELHFDAPLDRVLGERPAFGLLKDLGKTLASGLGDTLQRALPMTAPVLIAHDDWTQYQLPGREDAAQAASTDSGALFGLFRAAGALPELGFIDKMDATTLQRYQLVVWRHPGYIGQQSLGRLRAYVMGGGTLVVIGDGNGDVAITSSGTGQVIKLLDNLAAGWNGDDFPHLVRAGENLRQAKELLVRAGITPLLEVAAGGQEPFVHAWLQTAEGSQGSVEPHRPPGQGRTLLYVENFTRDTIRATVRVTESALPPEIGEIVRLVPRFSSGNGASVTVSKGMLTTLGVELPVTADGVDLWEIEPAE